MRAWRHRQNFRSPTAYVVGSTVFLTNIWFREINIVDDENLPNEGGILYITWHSQRFD